MDVLIALGAVLLLGLAGGLVSRRLNLPSITGYVAVGLIIGPTVLGVVNAESAEALEPITSIALGVIAYLIGTSLQLGTLRSLGRSISWITILEAFGGFAAVAIVLALVGGLLMPGYTFRETYLPFALLMGAISCATAPAAVLAIVREYRAKGPLTTTLLAVVALDDAVGVIFYAIAAAFSATLVGTTLSSGSLLSTLAQPLVHIAGALAFGAAIGGLALLVSRLIRAREMALVLVLGMVMLGYGLAEELGLSGIMSCMAVGFVIGNRKKSGELIAAVDEIQAVLFTMFFVIAGLHFDAGSFAVAGPIAGVVVVARCLGKYAGTRLGAVVGKAPTSVGKNLGLALLPQAGVSIGLTLVAAVSFPGLANYMVSATLASVIINELITPPLARKALVNAGEARLESSRDESRVGETTVAAPEPAPAAAQTSVGLEGSTYGHHVSSGPLAVRTSTAYLHEGPWARSQRARNRPPRDR